MTQKNVFPSCVLLILLLMSACSPLQPTLVAPVPTDTSTVVPVPSVMSTITLTLEPTSTHTSTPLPVPTTAATQPPTDIGPFHFIASLAGLPAESTEEVQVRALADGSVWIITSQAAMRWDGQAWEVVIDESEGMLADVDDGGKLWVLLQDTSEISAWQEWTWITYGADSGWTEVGLFEENWWATEPWGVCNDENGILWTPLEHDVRAFDGIKWKVYTLEDMGFPVQEMEDISIVHNLTMVKDNPDVWVGECYYSGPGPMGGGGIRWFDGETWHGDGEPIGSTCVSAMTVDERGDVWLGAYDSVWKYEHTGQSWREYTLPENLLLGFNFSHPRQLIVDLAGDAWVIEQMCGGASCDGPIHLYRIQDEEWSLIMDAEYWGSSFKQLVLDGNEHGWLFWEGMFYRLGGNTLEPITSIAARGVDVSPDGTLWVVAGSEDGISLYALEP